MRKPPVVRRLTFCLALLAAACATPAQVAPLPLPAPTAGPPPAALRWRAVLVAGDASLPVWDNAVARLSAGLVAAGSPPPRTLSAAANTPADRVASLPNILAAIAELRPRPGEGCLVFATAHGMPRRGLVLPRTQQILEPRELAAALATGCGNAPTVVIASGCFTGHFADAPLAAPNRAVFTAARADRSSFGCGAGLRYTYFDECLLTTLERPIPTWTDVVGTVQRCVTRRETAEGVTAPSLPQSSIGTEVARLPSPLAAVKRS